MFFAPFAILGMLLFAFLGGEIVKYLWNWLVPSLFGLPQVTFWQALGLLALCRILFGGMGGRASGRSRSNVRSRMAERCAAVRLCRNHVVSPALVLFDRKKQRTPRHKRYPPGIRTFARQPRLSPLDSRYRPRRAAIERG